MQSLKSFKRSAWIVVLSAIMSGCMLGPDFHSPAAPAVSRYTAKPLPAKTAQTHNAGSVGKAQYFVKDQNIPAQWWYLFHSPAINELIITGLNHNQNLTAAYAALRQAQETVNAQVGNALFPAFSGQAGGQRQLFTGQTIGGNAPSQIFNLYNTNVNVTYTLDIFGGARRQIEALVAQVDYQQFQLIAAYLSMTANIVTTAVTVASYKAQIQATHALISAEDEQLAILRKQYYLGGISRENVLTQETLVAQTRATLPPLEKNLSLSKHALAVLIGAYPDVPLPEINLESLSLPSHIPVSLASNLVRQRPDVQASEALLHAASAQIGVATANLLPQFGITGYYGWQAPAPSSLFGTTTNAWSIAAMITQPIFQGGALLAQRRAAIAAYENAFAQYKQVVLQAFQNVADSLRAIETDARTFREQKAAEIAARNNLALTRQQYHLGGSSYLNLLTAQQQYQQTVITRIQAQAARYADTAALFQALGGGWWNKQWCEPECGPDYDEGQAHRHRRRSAT